MDAFMAGAAGALGGAVGGLLGFFLARMTDWFAKPRLKIEIDSDSDGKAYVLPVSIDGDGWRKDRLLVERGYTQGLFLRLNVTNAGRSPAMNCEARFRVYSVRNGDRVREPAGGPMHWVIRDPDNEPERQFEPVHVNPKAVAESLDVLVLPFSSITTFDGGERQDRTYYADALRFYSVQPYLIHPNKEYELEITVSANNTVAKPVRLKINWNGTPEHFTSGELVRSIS